MTKVPKEVFDCPVHQIIRVVDGDTQHLLLDRGWRTLQGITTRVADIDTPEKNTDAGEYVAEVVQVWLARVQQVKYRLRWLSKDLDMYGRSLGDYVDREHPQQTLSQFLLEHQMAKPYEGKRSVWTDAELQAALASAVAFLNQ